MKNPNKTAREAETPVVYRLKDFELDPTCFELRRDGHTVAVEPQVLELLIYLVANRDRAVTRAELFETLWSGRVVGDSALNSRIKEARSAIGDDGKSQTQIRTLHRMGYRFVGRLEEVPATAADAALPVVFAAAKPSVTASIAVLPFVNMSADAEQEYFSDGLSEELINQLARLKTLSVAGRTSSFAFKNKALDFAEIGKKLGVRYVLEGSVRKAGKRLRITAQLIKCADGFHLWSERFDRDLDDVFAIQDEIAVAVADKLRVTLGVDGTRMPGGTENAEAYDLVLRARALIRRRQAGDPERAAELLRRALALDAQFALAWNVLGNALISVLSFGQENPQELRKQIEDALERSVALAPELWTGHEAHANLLELRHDWVGAEQANARARALAPKSMREPVVSRCHQLAAVGRIREAIHFAREAKRIEPLVATPLADLLSFVGQHEESELEYERERESIQSPFLGNMLACVRMMAIADHSRAKHHLALCAAADVSSPSFHREVLEVFDDAPRARALIQRCVETTPDRDFVRLLTIAPYTAYFGMRDVALTVYQRIAKHLIGVFIMNIWSPLHAEMRRLPGFKEFVRAIGLVTYWRTTGEWGEFARPVGDDDFECW